MNKIDVFGGSLFKKMSPDEENNMNSLVKNVYIKNVETMKLIMIKSLTIGVVFLKVYYICNN